MCGIIGYFGNRNGTEIALEGIKKLEYRGYDSAGVAVKNGSGIFIHKDTGRVEKVFSGFDTQKFSGNIALYHTRWATHGGVTKENAHPHLSNDGKIAVVHNGIVENYQELRNFLQSKGYKFSSQTDTETIPILIQYFMDQGLDFLKAFKQTLKTIDGAYAVLALREDQHILLAARKDSPLVIGVGDKEYFIASDIPAFLDHTKNVLFFKDNELAIIDKSGVKLENLLTGESVERKPDIIDWSPEQAKKGNFDHFTIKEILEQVDTVKRSLLQDKQKVEKIAKLIRKAENIVFVACGTASYACRHANYIFSKIAKMNTTTIIGSEFSNYLDFVNEKTLVIAVSQSGETMDTLLPIKAAKERGAETVAVVNVMGSTIMREADHYLMTNAGPEISVVSTKAFTAQVALLTLLAYAVAGKYDDGKEKLQNLIYILFHLTSGAAREHTKKVAELLKDKEHIYLIGRGLQYTTAMEAALKIKEISYIHAEAYPGGELKHGTIALIEKGTPCIVFVSEDTEKEIISNATELKARGAIIIGVGPKNNEVFDHWIRVWDAGIFNSICQILPMQMLAYQLAVLRGCDPDKPRNLAKSVTVK